MPSLLYLLIFILLLFTMKSLACPLRHSLVGRPYFSLATIKEAADKLRQCLTTEQQKIGQPQSKEIQQAEAYFANKKWTVQFEKGILIVSSQATSYRVRLSYDIGAKGYRWGADLRQDISDRFKTMMQELNETQGPNKVEELRLLIKNSKDMSSRWMVADCLVFYDDKNLELRNVQFSKTAAQPPLGEDLPELYPQTNRRLYALPKVYCQLQQVIQEDFEVSHLAVKSLIVLSKKYLFLAQSQWAEDFKLLL